MQPELLGQGEGAGQARRGRVDDAGEMGVVEIEAVDQDAVGQRRIAHGEALRAADHRALPWATEGGDAGERALRVRIGVRGQPNAKRVEDEELGVVEHRARDVGEGQGRREGGELLCWLWSLRRLVGPFNLRHPTAPSAHTLSQAQPTTHLKARRVLNVVHHGTPRSALTGARLSLARPGRPAARAAARHKRRRPRVRLDSTGAGSRS